MQIVVAGLILVSGTATCLCADLRILVVPKGTGTGYWASVNQGARKAGEELKIAVTVRGPQTQDQHQAQVGIIAMGIRQAYDAIVLAPNHVQRAAAVLEAAVAQGIKVVLIDSNMNSRHHASFIESDNYQAGRAAARHLARLLGGKGEIALIRYMANHASTHEREMGFLDTLSADHPQIKVVADPRMGSSVGSAYHMVSALLKKTPSLDAIFSVNGQATIGTLRALREAGLLKKSRFIGFDLNPAIMDAIRKGEIDATIAQNPFQIGYLGVKTAHRLILNETVPEKIYTDTMLITAENLPSEAVQQFIRANIN
jgi:ribose transport system substrate-binding protein